MSEKEVLQVAKEQQGNLDTVTAYGVTARLVGVPLGLIQDARSKIHIPIVPTFFDENKQREYENPTDPEYLKSLQEYNDKIGQVSMDLFCMFGLEIDGMPDNDGWLNRVKWLEKRGDIDLSDYNINDEMDKEFLFKRYILGTADVIQSIAAKTAVTQGGVDRAKASFRSN